MLLTVKFFAAILLGSKTVLGCLIRTWAQKTHGTSESDAWCLALRPMLSSLDLPWCGLGSLHVSVASRVCRLELVSEKYGG